MTTSTSPTAWQTIMDGTSAARSVEVETTGGTVTLTPLWDDEQGVQLDLDGVTLTRADWHKLASAAAAILAWSPPAENP